MSTTDVQGAQKAGTSAPDAHLRTHPGVQMAREKEPHWFDHEPNFAGPPAREVYDSYEQYSQASEPLGEYRVGRRAAAYYLTTTMIAIAASGIRK